MFVPKRLCKGVPKAMELAKEKAAELGEEVDNDTVVKLDDICPDSEWQKGSGFPTLSKVEKVDSSE